MNDSKTKLMPQAMEILDLCSDTNDARTRYVGLDNRTAWTIEIAFFQCFDLSSNVPDNYIEDTGVMVGAKNEVGPRISRIDPCFAGGFHRPIQATKVTVTYKLRWKDSDVTYDYEAKADTGDLNEYFDHVEWPIEYKPNAFTREGHPIAMLSPQTKPKAIRS